MDLNHGTKRNQCIGDFLLCTLVIGVMVLHERCRLGNQNWQLCEWMGVPACRRALSAALTKEHGPWAVIFHASLRPTRLQVSRRPGRDGRRCPFLPTRRRDYQRGKDLDFSAWSADPRSLIRKEAAPHPGGSGVNLIPAATDSELLERQLHTWMTLLFRSSGSFRELVPRAVPRFGLPLPIPLGRPRECLRRRDVPPHLEQAPRTARQPEQQGRCTCEADVRAARCRSRRG